MVVVVRVGTTASLRLSDEGPFQCEGDNRQSLIDEGWQTMPHTKSLLPLTGGQLRNSRHGSEENQPGLCKGLELGKNNIMRFGVIWDESMWNYAKFIKKCLGGEVKWGIGRKVYRRGQPCKPQLVNTLVWTSAVPDLYSLSYLQVKSLLGYLLV